MYQATLYYGREGAVIQAMAGIDLALWDIKGKALKMPVWQVIGATLPRPPAGLRLQHDAVHARGHGRAGAARRKGDGFTAAKFGWEPFGKDARTDCRYPGRDAQGGRAATST